jgi:hypothetical protein
MSRKMNDEGDFLFLRPFKKEDKEELKEYRRIIRGLSSSRHEITFLSVTMSLTKGRIRWEFISSCS